jgi:hypothetical protein
VDISFQQGTGSGSSASEDNNTGACFCVVRLSQTKPTSPAASCTVFTNNIDVQSMNMFATSWLIHTFPQLKFFDVLAKAACNIAKLFNLKNVNG